MFDLAGVPDDVRPHWASCALVTVDVQRDTLDGGALEIAGTTRALGAMAALARAFRSAGRPIVHVVRLYLADGSNADRVRRGAVAGGGPMLRPGTDGSELAANLLPDPSVTLDHAALLRGEVQQIAHDEVALYKPRWGAFYDTALEDHLREAGIDTVVVCGANFPNCPRTTIYEASERDLRVVVAEDAVSGLNPQGAAELLGVGVVLAPAAAIVAALAAGGGEEPELG
jgi:nicotinamidase-related amidase